jgi:hypothetical protein
MAARRRGMTGGGRCSVGVRSGAERRRGELVRCGILRGVIGVAFIGPREGCRGGECGVTAGEGGGFNGRVNWLITAG